MLASTQFVASESILPTKDEGASEDDSARGDKVSEPYDIKDLFTDSSESSILNTPSDEPSAEQSQS